MSKTQTKLIQSLIRTDVLKLKAYHVPNASDMIKLDAMENPYSWSPQLKAEWLQLLETAEINRYPDPHCHVLNQTLKHVFEIEPDQEVLIGNGSDELIHILINAVAKPGAKILSFDPGFVMYETIALYNQVEYIKLPLTSEFEIDLDLTLTMIEQHQPALIFIAYPNNPTGNLFEQAAITKIIEAASGLVVVDEAYTAFADSSFISQIKNYENLLVLRTLSKMGLAGLRLGYLVGSPEWINEFDKMRMPYNINVLTQLSANFALNNKAVLDEQTKQICHDREILLDDLYAFASLAVFPSLANFILFRTEQEDAGTVHQALLQQNVLIKNLSKAGPLLANCLRVTVGTAVENQQFLKALRSALN